MLLSIVQKKKYSFSSFLKEIDWIVAKTHGKGEALIGNHLRKSKFLKNSFPNKGIKRHKLLIIRMILSTSFLVRSNSNRISNNPKPITNGSNLSRIKTRDKWVKLNFNSSKIKRYRLAQQFSDISWEQFFMRNQPWN